MVACRQSWHDSDSIRYLCMPPHPRPPRPAGSARRAPVAGTRLGKAVRPGGRTAAQPSLVSLPQCDRMSRPAAPADRRRRPPGAAVAAPLTETQWARRSRGGRRPGPFGASLPSHGQARDISRKCKMSSTQQGLSIGNDCQEYSSPTQHAFGLA